MQTTRILALLLACVGIARAALPTIDTQPANSTNCVGTAASFTVAASSDSTTNYQWYFNETNLLADATNATFSIASVALVDAGGYSVVVTNNDGAVTSIVATLTVNALPSVSVNSDTICVGGTATLTATTGASSPSYLWSPGGATTASIMVSPASTTVYTCLVTDGVTGCTNSGSGTVTVNALTAATGPSNTNGCVNGSVTLETVVSGTGPFSYVWRKDGGAPLSSTSNTLVLASLVVGDTGVYSVEVTGACNSVTNSATLTVNPLPTVTVNSDTICPGGTATLTATTDASSPSYLWSPGGATTASIMVSPGSTTVYTCTVTDGVTGCSRPGAGTVTVRTLLAATGPANIANACPGSTAVFTVSPTGTGPFTYVWRKNGGAALGETTATLTLTGITTADAATYTVEVTGPCNSVTNSATLTLVGNPSITANPGAPLISPAVGNGVVFNVTASSPVGLTYQWQTNNGSGFANVANGSGITGATGPTLAISNLSLALNNLQVRVQVSNCAGTSNSAFAVLTVRPIHGISFDFDTPGQWTNGPYNLDPGLNNWVTYGAASTTIGASPTAMATGGGSLQMQAFEVSTGGVGVATGSGAIDFVFNSGTDVSSTLLPATFDFSLNGKALIASVTIKLKNNTGANNRMTQVAFGTTTNYNNSWQGVNGLDRHGWMSVILQTPGAAASGLYGLRAQHKPIAGTAATEVFPVNTTTNGATGLNTTPGSLANTGTNGWYKLVAKFVNIKGTTANSFTVEASLQDLGPFGTNTAGPIVLAYPPFTIANADMVNQTNLFLMIRQAETGGLDYWDNIYVTTTTGAIAFVSPVENASAVEGQRVLFKALVDGDGPYTYQWYKNGVAIPGAGEWRYRTPRLLLTDNGAEYSVTVTSTNNSISSTGVVTVTSQALAVNSVGSVDGGVIGVRFNGPVDPATATVAANYLVNGVPAIAAQMRPDFSDAYNNAKGAVNGQDVLITPDGTVSGTFTVTVSGITTLSGTALGAGNSATGAVEGLVGYEVDPNSAGSIHFAPENAPNGNGAVANFPGDNFSFAPGQFEITAGGHDIFGNFDGFRYVYRQVTGDFDVKMRVVYESYIRTPTKAGFNARASLDAYSPNVGVYADPQPPGRNIFEGTFRPLYDVASSSWGTNTGCTFPNAWLRLRRSGNTFIRYSSTNGVDWLCDGQISPGNIGNGGYAWPDTLYLGIAGNCNVGAGAIQMPNQIQVDGYGDFAGYSGVNIGIVTQPANATVAAGSSATFTVVAIATNAPKNGQAGEMSYVWQKTNSVAGGWTNLPNAGVTNAVFTTAAQSGADNGLGYRVIIRVPGGASVTSSVATVTITDTAAPTLAINNGAVGGQSGVFVPSNSLDRIIVNFSEAVSAATALNPANYLLTNSAGATISISNVAFNWIGDQRQVIITTTAPLPADTYGLRISGVQDLFGNGIVTVTRTFYQGYSFFPPVAMEVYWHLPNTAGLDALLLTNDFLTRSPQYFTFSNVMGFNHQVNQGRTGVEDNYGVRMYSYFVPTQSLQYTFWFRADDFAQFFMNTNSTGSTNPAGKVSSFRMGVNNAAYHLTNTFVTPTLTAGQKYYIEYCFKETGGGDHAGVMVTTGTTNGLTAAPAMVSGITNVLGSDLLRYPAEVVPQPKMIVELYTNLLYSGQNLFPANPGLAAVANGNKSELVIGTNQPKYLIHLPDMVGALKSPGFQLNLGQSALDNYLGRFYGYFVPPTNGNYKFWIRSDDACQLYMNTNVVNTTDPAGKNFLAEITQFYNVNYISNKVVTLVGGQRYYLEGIWREGTGGDGMSIAVRSGADNTVPPNTELIPLTMLEYPTNLAPYGAVNFSMAGSNPGVIPMNPTVPEGTSLTFSPRGLAGAPPYMISWFKNGVLVGSQSNYWNGGAGTTSTLQNNELQPDYRTLPLTLADNGAVFSLVVSNQFSVVTQSSTVTVTADSTAPTIASAAGSQFENSVLLTFSENVDPLTAGQLANYRINGGVTVLSVTFDAVAKNRVSLRTTPQQPGAAYTVTVNGVRDPAGNAMVNVMKTFTAWGYGGLGTLFVEYWTNLLGASFDALLNDPKYINNQPDGSYYTNVFIAGQFGAETGRNFWGARVTGMFMPPSNGLYRFFIRGDDGTKLFINTNGPDASGAVLVAQNNGANSGTYYNGVSANNIFGTSFSPPISMTNGTPYFMQAIFKEGTGGDHMEVVFRGVDHTGVDYPPLGAPAVGDAMSAGLFQTVGNPDLVKFLIASQPPSELTVTQSAPVLLEFIATTLPPSMVNFATYQWQKTNSGTGTFTNIPGATLPSLFFYANLADDGATYRLLASIPGTKLVLPTLLHVLPDVEPPYLVSVSSLEGYTIGVRFDGPVDPGIAQEPSGYYFDPPFDGVIVSTAVLKPGDPTRVLLTLDPLSIPVPIYGDFGLYCDFMKDFAGNEAFGLFATGAVQRLTPRDIYLTAGNVAGGYNLAMPGSTWTDTNGGFDISANGYDIWNTADGFHFASREVTGNFDIKTRINKLQGADQWSKAGLMARGSTNANSRMMFMCAVPATTPVAGQLPNNFFAAQYRDTDGGAPGNVQNTVPPSYPNAAVRLQRSNSVFYGFWSTNGTAGPWTLLFSRDTATNAGGAFPDTLQVGLATTSHDQTRALANNAYAEYRDLYFPPGAVISAQPEPTETTIVIGINQSVTFSNLVATGNLQWRKNGLPVPGANSATLTIADTSVSDSGTYNVAASTDGGGQISSNIYLIVTNSILVATNDSITATQNVAYTFPTTLLTGNDFDPEGDPISILAVYTPHTIATNFDAGLLTGMTLYGPTTNAYWTNQTGVGNSGSLHLNNAVNNTIGSAIISPITPGARVLAFTANFKLRIGDGSAEPADGFSFNFASDLPNDGSAPLAAEQGVGTGFSFCVDNYRFAPLAVGAAAGAPGGGTANTSGIKIQYGGIILAGVQTPVWNNPNYIPVSITIDIFGNLTVMVDGTNAFTRTIAWVPTAGRFGFYGRTGGQSQTHWIDDLEIRLLEEDTARGGLVSLSGSDITYTPPTGACGTDSFYYLASDGQFGGTNVGLVTVNILTTNGPSITTCVPSQNISTGAGCTGLLPDLRSQLVVADCGDVTITQDPAPGTSLPLGPTLVTFNVTNTSGFGTNCQATITVVDLTAPVAICPGNITNEATSASGATVSFSVSGSDNCTLSSVVAVPASGSTFPIGTTTVTVTATDAAGNTNACTFTVTVQDTTGPSISCPANQVIACSSTNGAVAIYSASATDAVDPSPTVFITPPSGSTFPVGTNVVVVTAYDATGNTNTCAFNVVVQDQTPAVLTITKVDTNAIVCWPQSCTTYTLESTTNLNPPIAWSPVGLPVDVAGTNYCVTVPIQGAGTNTFFRLFKP